MTDNGYFNINEFRNAVTEYHRPSSFHLLLNTPTLLQNNLSSNFQQQFKNISSKLQFLIEASNVPGVDLTTDEIRRYGYGPFQRKPFVPTFEQLMAVVRSDANGDAYAYFQSWLKAIINFDARNGIAGGNGIGGSAPYEVNYKVNYAVDADIVMYDDMGNETVRITMRDVFPTYLGDIAVDWGDGNSIVKFPLRLTYTDWFMANNEVTTSYAAS